MRRAHRLVGWWLSVAFAVGFTPVAYAQSTATFPDETAQSTAPANPTPAQPEPPVVPQPPPAGTAGQAPIGPTVGEQPYTPHVAPGYATPELPTPGRDARPPILPYEDGMPVP